MCADGRLEGGLALADLPLNRGKRGSASARLQKRADPLRNLLGRYFKFLRGFGRDEGRLLSGASSS